MINAAEADLLLRAAGQVSDGCIVEVGSYRGRSTVALAIGSRRGGRVPVFAVEPHEEFDGALGGKFGPPDRAAFFKSMLASEAWREVRLVNLSSEVITKGWKFPVGLLFIDGDHTYEGVKKDWEAWSPHLTTDATVIFDDTLNESIGPARLLRELSVPPIEVVGKMTAIRAPRAQADARLT